MIFSQFNYLVGYEPYYWLFIHYKNTNTCGNIINKKNEVSSIVARTERFYSFNLELEYEK